MFGVSLIWFHLRLIADLLVPGTRSKWSKWTRPPAGRGPKSTTPATKRATTSGSPSDPRGSASAARPRDGRPRHAAAARRVRAAVHPIGPETAMSTKRPGVQIWRAGPAPSRTCGSSTLARSGWRAARWHCTAHAPPASGRRGRRGTPAPSGPRAAGMPPRRATMPAAVRRRQRAPKHRAPVVRCAHSRT